MRCVGSLSCLRTPKQRRPRNETKPLTESLFESNLASPELVARGKVRDIYRVDADRLLIVATDRLSAFDVILPDPIPGKGVVLTSISNFWFKKLESVVPNHLTGVEPEAVLSDPRDHVAVKNRAVVVQKLKPVPVEAVIVPEGAAELPAPQEGGPRVERRARDRSQSRDDRERERPEAKIEDLLKEGQEILVQVVKEPLGTKGARLTSHVTMPGRFLVFMPTVDHIGVSRKIESREERARLRGIVREFRESHGFGGGVIIRIAAASRSKEDILSDLEAFNVMPAS